MKHLFSIVFITLIASILFAKGQSSNLDNAIDERQKWIESIMTVDGKPIKSKDYIFYFTGHHGLIWSLITLDSSEIHLYNGTTRSEIDTAGQIVPDTLTFIRNNIKTIKWGIDSLAKAAKLLNPALDKNYNPFYSELFIVRDGKVVFKYDSEELYNSIPGTEKFNEDLNRLRFLMYWLVCPSYRPYLPVPADTL